ncbi:polymorphic toxin type 44 domain-containing protein [Azospirillum sp. Sh1]|uniref:polymorphic toxin type 44 domain-containing protein n=1 Tax=Azospirillum sp. Sh1 TaxID=2607285 RepID=UPI00165DBC20|nr:polymorphic toxin type 44 domain-containing protein [Azospirillum sp. Sh1]
MQPMTSPASFIHKEMIKNSSSQIVANIAKKSTPVSDLAISASGADGQIATGFLRTMYAVQDASADLICDYTIFAAWVGPGMPWDHKKEIRSAYGTWSYDGDTGRDYYFDIWSNIHYGYVGRACGFSVWTLKAGGGAAQLIARTMPDGYWKRRFESLGDADFLAACDDPCDQQAIILGADLWDRHGKTLTLTQMIARCREKATVLSTRSHVAGS